MELVDRMGLRVHFNVQSPLPVEQCADNLREIAFPIKKWPDRRSQQVELSPVDADTLQGRVMRKNRNRGVDYTSAQADFKLTDGGDGTTTIEGTARVSYLYVGMMAAFMVIFVIQMFIFTVVLESTPPLLLFVFAPAILGYFMWRIFRDRGDVLADIQQAIHAGPVKRHLPDE